MKKTVLLVLIFSFLTFATTFSQSINTYKKQPTVSVNFVLNDFETAQFLRNGSIGEVINNDNLSNFAQMSPGLSIAYLKGLSNHVDFMASLGGSFANYQFKNGRSNRSERLLLEADANVNVKLLTDNYIVNPYLTAGVGVSLYGVHYGAYIPLGFGLQFKLGQDAFLFTNLQHRTGITDFTSNHLNYSIGFGAPLGTAKSD